MENEVYEGLKNAGVHLDKYKTDISYNKAKISEAQANIAVSGQRIQNMLQEIAESAMRMQLQGKELELKEIDKEVQQLKQLMANKLRSAIVANEPLNTFFYGFINKFFGRG